MVGEGVGEKRGLSQDAPDRTDHLPWIAGGVLVTGGDGEVTGLGDGLWAWYGADRDEVNRLLWEEARGGRAVDAAAVACRALAYRQVLSLLLALDASAAVRREIFGGLVPPEPAAAHQWIVAIPEAMAFREIWRSWRRLGYPFRSLVPSYATAIGSSADRPDQLAELVGILLNDGVRYPLRRVEELRFAAGTPYETQLRPAARRGERVLSSEIAAVVRGAMVGVVTRGRCDAASGPCAPSTARPSRSAPRPAPATTGSAWSGRMGWSSRSERPDRDGRLLHRRPPLRHHHSIRLRDGRRPLRLQQCPATLTSKDDRPDAGTAGRGSPGLTSSSPWSRSDSQPQEKKAVAKRPPWC